MIRLEDALKNVSSVYQAFNNGFGETDYGLRGFRQFFVYEDGFRVPGFGSQEAAHLERVKMLKGPAATLYGRIEPGGFHPSGYQEAACHGFVRLTAAVRVF